MIRYLLLSLFLFLSFSASAQYCIPTGNCSYDDYIDDFSFNTISRQNSLGSNCGTNSYIFTSQTTTVVKGSTYSMSMQSGPDWAQGFGVWIDYNMNQNFNDPGEFVFASATTTTSVVTTNITIPNTALSGNTRMRVRCSYGQTLTANQSCVTLSYGETEDYTITIQANNAPPIADFFASSTSTCSGTVSFTDQTSGSPTSWLWDFGDGQTSTVQNPVHTYTTSGTYTVTLTATNAYGNNTKVKTNYITYSPGSAPVAASCSPGTTGNCCGFGITQFMFNTITNNSSDGSAGYQDFTCSQTTVLKGRSYNIYVKCDQPAPHNVRAWIDFNSNGTFETSELVFSANQVLQATGTVVIPATATINTGLRLRVSADYYVNAAPEPCTSPQVGQVEDYTIIVQNNTSRPDVNFSGTPTNSCNGFVSFSDMSQNLPTSWSWNFGDGNTSTSQNPSHTYAASGTYTVTLIATNSFGSDTLVKSNYISVNTGSSPVSAACTPVTTAYCCNYGIINVTLGTINNTTPDGIESYKDYSCGSSTNLNKGFTYTLSVRTGPDNPEDVMVWIDYNNDGTFNAGENVLSSANNFNHSASVLIPNNAVLNTPLRMRVMSDFVGSGLSACDNVQWGQVEDYTVIILDPISSNSLEDLLTIKAYPNPANDFVKLQIFDPYNEDHQLQVLDLSGRLVISESIKAGITEFTVDLKGLSGGMYVLRLSSIHSTHSEKILKQK